MAHDLTLVRGPSQELSWGTVFGLSLLLTHKGTNEDEFHVCMACHAESKALTGSLGNSVRAAPVGDFPARARLGRVHFTFEGLPDGKGCLLAVVRPGRHLVMRNGCLVRHAALLPAPGNAYTANSAIFRPR